MSSLKPNKQKKLLMYLAYPIWPRLETEIEIAQKYISQGYELVITACTGKLTRCPSNPNHRRLICKACNARLSKGLSLLDADNYIFIALSDFQTNKGTKSKGYSNFAKPDEIKNFKIQGSDLGLSAYSELVAETNNVKLILNKKIKNKITKLIDNSITVHYFFKELLSKVKPDEVILFNGRVSAYRPALRAAVSMNIKTKVFEVGNKFSQYILTEGYYPHDLLKLGQDVHESFLKNQLNDDEKKNITDHWFSQRRSTTPNEFAKFNEKFKKNSIKNIVTNENHLKVGIFISTEAEFIGIEELNLNFYSNQSRGIDQIANSMNNEEISFIVRAHPHLKSPQNSQFLELKEIAAKHKNIKLINPNSKIDTYDLIEFVDIVVVFYSTVGIESIHMNKPTIVLGPAIYSDFGGSVNPKSHEDLISVLRLVLKNRKEISHIFPEKHAMERAAQIYAVGFETFSHELKKSLPNSFSTYSTFYNEEKKIKIKPNIFLSIILKVFLTLKNISDIFSEKLFVISNLRNKF